jgi:16S rRNA (cytidine1402-2'-O)-methyltransferase
MGKIILVPTPLGNLEDMTFRAVRILHESTLILAEDTRKTGILLKHYQIETRMRSYHQHNEHGATRAILEGMGDGDIYALVTDAGTPGISDPGFLLVRTALDLGIEVMCLPGPSAFVPALVASGLPCDRFFFEGFLPVKKGRATRLGLLSMLNHTVVLYESPHRLARTLKDLCLHFGEDRSAVVAREISKIYEEYRRGTLKELALHYTNSMVKGEIVLIISGKD